MTIEPVPCRPFFLDDEAISHLAAMMRARPQAAGWHLAIVWAAGFGTCVEDREGPAQLGGWTMAWPTFRATSASLRLTPPAAQLDALQTHLLQTSEAHCEAVGGPPDGVRYLLDVYPTQTRLTVSF